MLGQLLKKQVIKEIIVILLLTVAWNQLIYFGSRLISSSWHHYDMTGSFDESVPFVPWTVIIYFGCYLFWAYNYWLAASSRNPNRYRVFSAELIAKTVCFILFLVIPTTNVRPEVTAGGVSGFLMRLLYTVDPADNLFPSVHCLVSWFCWIGVRGRKDIPALYRHFSLVFAIAVCIATMTTKQHVLPDVISGVLLAEICYLITRSKKIRNAYSTIIYKLTPKEKTAS